MTVEPTPLSEIALGEDDMDLKDRVWKIFGSEEVMSRSELAGRLDSPRQVQHMVVLGVLERDGLNVRKTTRPIVPYCRPHMIGSEFGSDADASTTPKTPRNGAVDSFRGTTRARVEKKLKDLTDLDLKILKAACDSVEWDTPKHGFRIRLKLALVLLAMRGVFATKSNIVVVLDKLGFDYYPSDSMISLPEWLRDMVFRVLSHYISKKGGGAIGPLFYITKENILDLLKRYFTTYRL